MKITAQAILSCLLVIAPASAEDAFTLEGNWAAVTTLPGGSERESVLAISKTDEGFAGEVETSNGGKRPLKDIKVSEKDVSLAVDLEYEGSPFVFTVAAKAADPDTLLGNWKALDLEGEERATGAWQAKRKVEEPHPLVGEWKAMAMAPEENKLTFDMTIHETDGKLGGSMKSEAGSIPIESLEFADEKATLKVPFPYDGTTYPVTITATLEGDHLSGRWVALNAEGEEEAGGEWKASRVGAPTLEGAWSVTATLSDGTENESVYHFEPNEDTIWKGKAVGEAGELTFEKVTLEDKALTVDMTIPYDGAELELRVKATVDEDMETISGKWVTFDSTGQESASGDWKAARKTDS